MSTSVDEPVHLDIRLVAGKIDAEIVGVRLSGDLDEPAITAIRQALYRYKVIFFRGQNHLDEGTQEAFGKRLGNLVPHPTVPSLKGTDYVLDIDGGRGVRASSWHTDVTFVDAYPQASILRALVVPEYGGDIVWANTSAGYQSLPSKLRDLADSFGRCIAMRMTTRDISRTRVLKLRNAITKYSLQPSMRLNIRLFEYILKPAKELSFLGISYKSYSICRAPIRLICWPFFRIT